MSGFINFLCVLMYRGAGRSAVSSVILAERENDSRTEKCVSLPWRNQRWDSSVAALPLNDVQEVKCGAGCSGNGDSGTQGFRHSEAAGRGIPYGGAEQYDVVTLEEPTGGLRRRKVRSTPLSPYGESFAHSIAPPFRTRSAALGSRPRRGVSLTQALNDGSNLYTRFL